MKSASSYFPYYVYVYSAKTRRAAGPDRPPARGKGGPLSAVCPLPLCGDQAPARISLTTAARRWGSESKRRASASASPLVSVDSGDGCDL